jgi:hypothetical protein
MGNIWSSLFDGYAPDGVPIRAAHSLKFMQRGGRVFATHGGLPKIDHITVENPDGSCALVLMNGGLQRRVQCAIRDTSPEVKIGSTLVL